MTARGGNMPTTNAGNPVLTLDPVKTNSYNLVTYKTQNHRTLSARSLL